MIRSNILQLLRQLKKERYYSFFNIIGLAIGMAITVLVILYVFNVNGFEKHNAKYERIYKFGVNMTIAGNSSTQPICNASVGPLLKDYMPGIEQYTRTRYVDSAPVVVDNKHFQEERLLWADPSIYEVFTYDIVQGDLIKCATDPKSIAISESTAKKYFGDKSAIGELIELEEIESFAVGAVYKDLPRNSHIRNNMILPLSKMLKMEGEDGTPSVSRLGGMMGYDLYFLFDESFGTKAFDNAFQRFYDQYLKEKDIMEYTAVVEPIHSLFLNSRIWESSSERNRQTFYGFISVGIFILLLASINYINLSTARAETRALEIGLRKVIGANRNQLMGQFMFESLFFSTVSMGVGLALAYSIMLYTPLNDLLRLELNFDHILIPEIGFTLIAITLIIGIISGIYPAMFLSAIRPIKALNKSYKIKYSKFSFRNILVVIQLIVSIAAIILSLLMNNQIKAMLNSDKGFDAENVLALEIAGESQKLKANAFRNDLISNPNILSTSFSNTTPGFESMGYIFKWENEEGAMELIDAVQFYVEPEYYETMNIAFEAGTNFKRRRQESDTTYNFIVNETLVKKMGWTDPIGKRNSFGRVVGVVKDFNYGSYHYDLRSTYMLQYKPSRIPDLLNIRISDQNVSETVDFIKTMWSGHFGDQVANISFIDDRMQTLYENNESQILLNNVFSILCIVISCIGLIGLTTYVASKRTREIAIRKVFGANEIQLFLELFTGIFYKILLSAVIASFLGQYFFQSWQENFNFQPPIGLSAFIVPFVAAVLLTLVISYYQARKIIIKNPVVTLKQD